MVQIRKPPDVLVPTGRTPGQFADPGIEGGVGQAGKALGRSVQALAAPFINIAGQIAAIQDAGEEAQVQGLVTTELKNMEAYMKANPSLYPEFEAKWGEAETRIEEAVKTTTRKRTQDRLQNWIKKYSPIWKAPVTQAIQDGIGIKTRADVLTTVDELITSNLREDAKAASDIEKGVFVDEREVKLARIKELIENANVNGMLWNDEELRVLENQIEKRIELYENTRHLAEESEVVYGAINAKQYELAHDLTDRADITEKQKTELHTEIDYNQARNENNELRIQKETWEKNEKAELWEPYRTGELTQSRIDELYRSGAISRSDWANYTNILTAEREAGTKRREAETEILEAKDKRKAMRFLAEGIEKGEINKSFIYIVAEAHDLSSTELEGFVSDYNANKNAIVSYEPQAELIELITGVQSGKVEPDDVKSKINDMMKASIAAGLPKDEAVTLGLKYREKLATAIKAGEENRSGAYLKTKARNLMEDLIRDKDPLQPDYYTADERQILATAESIIRLENYIDDASKTDKPLEGTELLIKAIEIGRDAKKMINEEKKAETPTIFRPLRRGMEKPVEKPKEEMPTAPAEKSDYEIWKSVRDKWYRLSTKTKMEIQAALIAINPKTKKRYTWFDVVNDPIIKAEMDKIK